MRLVEPWPTSRRHTVSPCTRRQVAVQDNHVVRSICRALQGRFAVVDHVDRESGVAQTFADPIGKSDEIVHNEYPHRHILHQRT